LRRWTVRVGCRGLTKLARVMNLTLERRVHESGRILEILQRYEVAFGSSLKAFPTRQAF
jgi:hypothetical protein